MLKSFLRLRLTMCKSHLGMLQASLESASRRAALRRPDPFVNEKKKSNDAKKRAWELRVNGRVSSNGIITSRFVSNFFCFGGGEN